MAAFLLGCRKPVWYAVGPRLFMCGHFENWKAKIERHPRQFTIRHVPTETSWSNRAARKFFGLPRPVGDWQVALRFVHHEDVARLEDAHSRALKLGGPQRVVVRVRILANRFVRLSMTLVASPCARFCRRGGSGCAVVATLISVDPTLTAAGA